MRLSISMPWVRNPRGPLHCLLWFVIQDSESSKSWTGPIVVISRAPCFRWSFLGNSVLLFFRFELLVEKNDEIGFCGIVFRNSQTRLAVSPECYCIFQCYSCTPALQLSSYRVLYNPGWNPSFPNNLRNHHSCERIIRRCGYLLISKCCLGSYSSVIANK